MILSRHIVVALSSIKMSFVDTSLDFSWIKLGIDFANLSLENISRLSYNYVTPSKVGLTNEGGCGIISYTEHTFGFNEFHTRRGGLSEMTENEQELLNIIRSHDNPERAVEIAINLILDFLPSREAPQDISSARPRESA